jgi:hypothetical protein
MFDSHLHAKISDLTRRNLQQQKDLEAALAENAVLTAGNKSLTEDCSRLRNNIDEEKRTLKFELLHAQELAAIKQEKALQAQANDMSKALIQSDISREQALSKLSVYEKMDTKADANTIKDMVSKLIDAIGKTNVNLLKSN